MIGFHVFGFTSTLLRKRQIAPRIHSPPPHTHTQTQTSGIHRLEWDLLTFHFPITHPRKQEKYFVDKRYKKENEIKKELFNLYKKKQEKTNKQTTTTDKHTIINKYNRLNLNLKWLTTQGEKKKREEGEKFPQETKENTQKNGIKRH